MRVLPEVQQEYHPSAQVGKPLHLERHAGDSMATPPVQKQFITGK